MSLCGDDDINSRLAGLSDLLERTERLEVVDPHTLALVLGASVVLGVSNQSFDDPAVQLVVAIDGIDLVEQSFAVEGQHTVTSFGLDLAPGSHTLTVVSDTGATTSEIFDLPEGVQRWIYVNYWYLDPAKEGVTWGGDETPGPSLVVTVSDKPMPIS